jgi:threonylcarbamoyladenosine tRNA methylthiotransferase MtaB
MTERKKVAFYTLGCKLNFSETSTIARNFTEEGFDRVDFEEVADIYVINTCSVTENADKQFKQVVRKAMKLNDKAFVAAVGCYAQLKPEELANVDGVDLVLGATEKFKITDYINDLSKNDMSEVHSCEISEADFYVGSYSIGDRTRAFLKVQDGCDYKCTYCTIPLARGISRSDALENVLKNAKEISEQNIKEIVLTGVNIGDYGKGEFGNKKHEHTFLELVQELDKVEGIERLRISSIEPNLLKNETIEFVSKSRTFVPHFHIPLQSGSNEILKLMKRRYLREVYTERVNKIREVMPHACIGVDVIVGSPGETEAYFKESFDFIHSLDISYLHVFTYSERAMTKALDIKRIVPVSVRNERNKILRNLSYQKQQYFNAQHVGTTRPVLFESIKQKDPNDIAMLEGYTDNYIRITTPFRAEWRVTNLF